MKTKLTSTLAALSAALLVSFNIASCASSHHTTAGGSHNMGVGPKENHPMPDANMPRRSSSEWKPLHNSKSGSHNMGVGPKDNHPMPDANMPGKR